MQVEHCIFPDDLYYDPDNDVWARIDTNEIVTVGLSSVLVGIAGKVTSIRLRELGSSLSRGQSIGTVESVKFVGPIPSPVTGIIVAVNSRLHERPKLLNDSPYDDGWIVQIRALHLCDDRLQLKSPSQIETLLRSKIHRFHVRCFRAYPDHEMYEIGTECLAVLVRLDDMIAHIPIGDVIHLVTDDPTAYVEMEVWKDRTGQEIVEWRRENNLQHFIIRKTK